MEVMDLCIYVIYMYVSLNLMNHSHNSENVSLSIIMRYPTSKADAYGQALHLRYRQKTFWFLQNDNHKGVDEILQMFEGKM